MADVSFAIGGQNAEFLAALAQCKDAVSQTASSIKSGMASLSGSFDDVSKRAEGIGAALDGLKAKFTAAFQVTGIALAFEAFQKLGEVITQLGERATQIHTMSDVIGLTSAQFQGLQVAAEESGVSIETTSRSVERLGVLLNSARDGSGAAIEKLHTLGITNDQIADSTFGVNEMLTALRDRLNNAATAADTMNALTKEFGNRAAMAAEAIKTYDGSEQGVQKSMAQVNGLSDAQIERLHQMHTWWSNLGTTIANTSSKLAIWVADMGKSGPMYDKFVTPAQQQDQGQSTAAQAFLAAMDQQRQKSEQIGQEMLGQEMENVKAGAEEFKQGTAQRLAALQEYARLARQFYGSDTVDTVVKANQAVMASQREFDDAQLRSANATTQALQAVVRDKEVQIRQTMQSIDEGIKNVGDFQNQTDELLGWSEEEATKVKLEHAKVLKEMTKLQEQQSKEMQKDWQFLTNSMASGMASAIEKMMTGTQSFAQAMRSMFTSIFDAIIKKLAEWVAQWIVQHLIALAASKTTAASEATTNAGVAASGAMASVAAIPFIGWAMAPGVGAATYAEALAIGLPKMDVGAWNLPSDMVAQLHKGETVVPTNFAEGMRQGGGFGGAGESHHYHGDVNVSGGDPLRALNTSRGRRELTQMIYGAVRRGAR